MWVFMSGLVLGLGQARDDDGGDDDEDDEGEDEGRFCEPNFLLLRWKIQIKFFPADQADLLEEDERTRRVSECPFPSSGSSWSISRR